MTEIAFLLDLVLNHKMSAEAKKRCIERIGEVEAKLSTQTPPPRPTTWAPTQSPSTLAALERHSIIEGPPPVPAVRAPTVLTEVVTSTTNGGSTRGPRKF